MKEAKEREQDKKPVGCTQGTKHKEAYILFLVANWKYEDAWFAEKKLKPLSACKQDYLEILSAFKGSNF